MILVVATPLEQVDAAALLVPVDGNLCRLGGAAAAALRAALPPDERADELDYVEDQLARMRPLSHPEACVIDGVARWSHLVVSAAYPHDVDGRQFSPHVCAQMLRAAIPRALAAAAAESIQSLAVPMIGTSYRMSHDLAVNALLDGLVTARTVDIYWCIPDAAMRTLAEHAVARLL